MHRILVLGCLGMLGNAVYRLFSQSPGYETFGTVRSLASVRNLHAAGGQFIAGVDVSDFDSVTGAFAKVRPTLVVENCVGLVKQLESSKDPLSAIPTDSMLPHRLSRLCGAAWARGSSTSAPTAYSPDKGVHEADLQMPRTSTVAASS